MNKYGMRCLGRKRVETGRENIKRIPPVYALRQWSFSQSLCPFLCLPPCAAHLPLPHSLHLPKLFFSVDSSFLLFPSPSLSLDLCSPLYVSASPEQTGLFSFTIGPGLEGWQTHKGSASLLGAEKKLKEGIVGTQQASALHQPRHECMYEHVKSVKWACGHTYVAHILQQQTPIHVSMQTVYIHLCLSFSFPRWCSLTHTYRRATETMTERGPGKLGQQSYLCGSALFGVCRVPSLPYKSGVFFS